MSRPMVWWQFSDIHWKEDSGRERESFIEYLLDELKGPTTERHGTPDFIAVTGDIAFSGKKAEYDSIAKQFFQPLQRLLPDGTPILPVPGNHDQNRAKAENLNYRKIISLNSPTAVDAFTADKDTIDAYITPFDEYSQFAANVFGESYSDPLSWSTILDIDGLRVAIVGANSAWSAHYPYLEDNSSDERRLLLSEGQIARPPSASSHFNILLMHHPIDWLNRDVCSRFEQGMRREFDIALTGHVHSPKDLYLMTGRGMDCCFVPSPLLYGQPYEDSIEFSRAFVVGCLDPASHKLEVYYYRYSDAFGAKFIPYIDLYQQGESCFAAQLTPRGSAREGSVHRDERSTFVAIATETQEAIEVRAAVKPAIESTRDSDRHTIEILRNLVSLVDSVNELSKIIHSNEVAATIFTLAELATIRGDIGLSDTRIREAVELRNDLNAMTSSDGSSTTAVANAVGPLIDSLSLVDLTGLANISARSNDPAVLLFALLWGLAQTALLLNRPALIPQTFGESQIDQTTDGNVISVATDAVGRIQIRLKTASRDEFHRIAETKHFLEQYFLLVEDLWRHSDIVPISIKFDVEFPLWPRRSLESYTMRVDPRPIARLLMGRALYGDRPHVWLRELVQNSIDATETRRHALIEEGYQPRIKLDLSDQHSVKISDNGIGMTGQHIVHFLATLGRSGWRTSDVQGKNHGDDAAAFFGRFGIGFASVFSVARRVTVRTRVAGGRSIDGWRTVFSGPDRPFFLEPNSCGEGTETIVELQDSVNSSELAPALKKLFVYIPSTLEVQPPIDIPSSLANVSAVRQRVKMSTVLAHSSRMSAFNIGGYPLVIRSEIFCFKRPKKEKDRQYFSRRLSDGPPAAVLDVCVDGIRVFEQPWIQMDESGRSGSTATDNSRRNNFDVEGLYVTIDFAREHSPVMPSRDALDVDKAFTESLMANVKDEFVALLPKFISSVAKNGLTTGSLREDVLHALASVTSHVQHWKYDNPYHPLEAVREAAAISYATHCPLLVRRADGSTEFIALADIAEKDRQIAVTESVATGRTFNVYAESSALTSWILLRDSVESDLLKLAWPFEAELRCVTSVKDLMDYLDVITEEIRTGQLVRLLRGDYALAKSPVFSGGLFFQVPSGNKQAKRNSAARRRIDMDVSIKPRCVLNYEHQLIGELEAYLEHANESDRSTIRRWMDSFCHGVVEDSTVQAPMAAWDNLRADLQNILGTNLSNIRYDSLRIHI